MHKKVDPKQIARVRALQRLAGASKLGPQQPVEKAKKKPISRSFKERPIKAMRSSVAIDNPKLLLDTPNVSMQVASEYSTPDWFRFKEKPEISIIIPMFKSNHVIKDLIESWDLNNDGFKVELIFVDDNCPSDSKTAVIHHWTKRQKNIKSGIGKIIYCSFNQGFSTACNIGAHYASADTLVFLNADTVTQADWLRPLIRMAKKPEVGVVGNLQLRDGGNHHGMIDSAGSEWSWDRASFLHIGRDIYRGHFLAKPFSLDNCPKDLLEPGEREMVTGACIAIRKAVFDEVGGFNPNYRIGYWEDAELCMAVKEKGYKVMYQPHSRILHKGSHTHSTTHRFANHNANYFANNWITSQRIDKHVGTPRKSPPLEVRNVLIRRLAAHGDVLIASAVAAAIKKKYQNCKVMFHTICPEVVDGNPYIDKVIKDQEISERTFQLYYNLDMAYELRPHTNLLDTYADVVGVEKSDCKLFLKTDPVEGLPEKYIAIHAGRTSWVGRDWSPMKFEILANKMKKFGLPIVCVGTRADHKITCEHDLRGSTTIPELAHVLKHASLFVGIDSFPMHVAQVFDTPGVCFFGSVLPETRIVSPVMHGVTAPALKCLGCHHRQPAPCPVTNVCETGMLDCINNVKVEMMLSKIEQVWLSTQEKINTTAQ